MRTKQSYLTLLPLCILASSIVCKDHCDTNRWTAQLCHDCYDTWNMKKDGTGCSKVDCYEVDKWTAYECGECWSAKIYPNILGNQCIFTDCSKTTQFTEETCTQCYGNNYYPTDNNRRCSTVNCPRENIIGKLTDLICSECTSSNTPYANLDKSACVSYKCSSAQPFDQVTCFKCYMEPLYLMFDNRGCTNVNCNEISEFDDQICTKCYGKKAIATQDKTSCKITEQPNQNFRQQQH